MSLAEKFQITTPYKEEANGEDGNWTSFDSARKVDDNPKPNIENKFNMLPKTEIFSPLNMAGGNSSRSDAFVQGFGGNTDVSGEGGKGINDQKTFAQGYCRREMKATDDQYSGEHIDLFYGEAVDEKGNVGFPCHILA